jgi:NHL repeat
VDLRWPVAWAEDRAPWQHDLNAVAGTKTEEGRQEAAPHSTFGIGNKALNRFYSFLPQPVANAANRKLHFTLNHYNDTAALGVVMIVIRLMVPSRRPQNMRCPRFFIVLFSFGLVGVFSNPIGIQSVYGQEPQDRTGINRSAGSDIVNLGKPGPSEGRLTLVAGGKAIGDSNTPEPSVVSPFGTGFNADHALFFVEMTSHRLRKLGRDGQIFTLAGSGHKGNGGDQGPAAKAELNGPHSLAVAKNGDIFVADTWNNRIRKIDAQSDLITNFAGTGKKGFSGDGGPAIQAEFGGVYCLALDEPNQTLNVADLDNRRIRQIDLKTGVVSTVAGNGKKGVPKDGDDARAAPLVDPRAVAVDGSGNLYILERSGHALRVVDRSGKIRTLAGTSQPGDSGDGGDARLARLNGPKHLCVSPQGSVIIADTENHRIRVYDPQNRTITTIAGTGRKGSAGLGGPANQAELAQPHGVTVGPDGFLYIADSSNNRIVRIEP